eukprot:gnl/MRDRNA2_/MRDRNA2_108046_c0_seq1.p1 gnl/MRDRNA2_/MRDRNA2_108046_c0~~gnl/MRDRNA2_/MRDRNA2_108046_c0_seq1.p1  ORF type:complete len:390 (+),score=60.15 gnl/MRDRNA2_/MRDRNA2_108046_c0_seq1:125-1294(+)
MIQTEVHPVAMSPYVAAGRSFREREAKIDKVTAQYHSLGGQQIRQHTLSAIDRFENVNNLVPAKTPPSPKRGSAQPLHHNREISLPTLHHEPKAPAKSMLSTKFVRKPCTPVEMYDYGGVNVRSLSVNSINPHVRKEIRSIDSFCSAPLGGLPLSIQEPIFMKPRRPSNPTLPFEGVVELPPLKRAVSYQALLGKPTCATQVRSTRFQNCRAEAYQQGLANEFMEEQLEEQRSWDGRHGFGWKDQKWRDHLGWLSTHGRQDESSWMDQPSNTWTAQQQKVYKVLSAVHEHLKERRIRVRELFKALDSDMTGALEPEELLAGLRKMRIAGCDRLPMSDFIEVLKAVDTNFDGSLSLPELDRAMCRIARLRAEARRIQYQGQRRRHGIIST